MSGNKFSVVLTKLRKEKGLSQKYAAQELKISQALLSHYEKGIRECGLNFLINAADFYGVSCDYLLGRTAEREEKKQPGKIKPDCADIINNAILHLRELEKMCPEAIKSFELMI